MGFQISGCCGFLVRVSGVFRTDIIKGCLGF